MRIWPNDPDNDADNDGVSGDVDCEPHSDLSPTVVVNGTDTGVTNHLFDDGCTINDLIAQIAASSSSPKKFHTKVKALTRSLKKDGILSRAEQGAIDAAAKAP